ncbi:MAG: glycosyltransferase family 2 protein, partial [Bacteroidales bacterium]|nr:glycosyltransferase family 2 protein [Bacteroidales bacterium]
MNHSKVSVIIPVYNMELYLAETLESVLKSDYPNFEVIVMDDESTDKSLSIAEYYKKKDSRIRIFSQRNEGASSARNNAIKEAQGRYILPVDADNLISDNYISEAAKVLDENPSVKLVSSEAEYIGDKSGRWRFEKFSVNLLCRRNLVDNCSMYRKSDWEKVGGY